MQINKKKTWGPRSRDRVRGSIVLGIGLGGSIGIGKDWGGVNRVGNWDRVRAGGVSVTLYEKHPPPTPPKKEKVEKSPS